MQLVEFSSKWLHSSHKYSYGHSDFKVRKLDRPLPLARGGASDTLHMELDFLHTNCSAFYAAGYIFHLAAHSFELFFLSMIYSSSKCGLDSPVMS